MSKSKCKVWVRRACQNLKKVTVCWGLAAEELVSRWHYNRECPWVWFRVTVTAIGWTRCHGLLFISRPCDRPHAVSTWGNTVGRKSIHSTKITSCQYAAQCSFSDILHLKNYIAIMLTCPFGVGGLLGVLNELDQLKRLVKQITRGSNEMHCDYSN